MAARQLHQLKAKQVENERRPGRYADGGGLYLQVQASSDGRSVTKSWLFRYMVAGRAREMGLGPLHTVPLGTYAIAEHGGRKREIRGARDLAADARRLLLAGIDPIEDRRARTAVERIDDARAKTFRECAEAYVRAHRSGWSNEKHAAQWESTLEAYCYRILGSLPVSKVDTGLVIKVLEQPVNVGTAKRPRLEPLWTARAETASRLRGRIETILAWATVRGYRAGENPARWRGHLDQTLPKISRVARIEHHAALPFDEAPAFLKELREQPGVAAHALEFLILTASRTGEVIGATWPEIDLAAGIWTIPAERMKGKREHRVPLVGRAIEILRAMEPYRDGEYVFPGRGRNKGLSNMALLKTLERMKRDDVTVHGFRSTFRDWASERTTFAREVIEMALAHAIGDKVEAAYRRGDLFDKRRKLMEAWRSFLARPASSSVVPIGARRIEVARAAGLGARARSPA